MKRNARALHVEALEALLNQHMAKLFLARDWELLREVARMAQGDAPVSLAVTDPALFQSWRNAVTRYHLGGWTNMTPARIEEVTQNGASGQLDTASIPIHVLA